MTTHRLPLLGSGYAPAAYCPHCHAPYRLELHACPECTERRTAALEANANRNHWIALAEALSQDHPDYADCLAMIKGQEGPRMALWDGLR